jgi:hypothetical protein
MVHVNPFQPEMTRGVSFALCSVRSVVSKALSPCGPVTDDLENAAGRCFFFQRLRIQADTCGRDKQAIQARPAERLASR